jgi:PhoH-like ATPase
LGAKRSSDSSNLAASGDSGAPGATVVLDTSVLIFDPDALFAFGETDVVVPLVVIEELDGLKFRTNDVGRAARQALRSIESLRVQAGGNIRNPVPLDEGGTLRVETNGLYLEDLSDAGLSEDSADNRILAAGIGLARQNAEGSVRIESNDSALRIKAAQLGLDAREYQRVPGSERAGSHARECRTLDVSGECIDTLYSELQLAADTALASMSAGTHSEGEEPEELKAFEENEFLVLRANRQSALCRHVSGEIHSLVSRRAWGLEPRSKEQRFALDLLLDPTIEVVALDGMAGTGKTLVSLATGLEQVVHDSRYDRLAIYRPVIPVGRSELGYLPGTLDEKLGPWMAAVLDAVTALTERRHQDDALRTVEQLTASRKLSMESVTFLRGRSLQRSFILVDEAQNLEPTTLKTILTRVGEGSKIVFTGDTSQIDAPYLSEFNNAIQVLIETFAGQPCFGHVRLSSCERSQVAGLAARLL